MAEGRIVRSLSGFYDVESEGKVYTCKARGVFRKDGITPLCGDHVRFTLPEEEDAEGTVDDVLPRRNVLSRPPLANLDQLFVIVSTCQPNPNLTLIDRMTALAVHKQIRPLLIVTKCDLSDARPVADIYRRAGIDTFCVGIGQEDALDAIRAQLRGRISAFTGNTGVGKSTLLNRIDPSLRLDTAQISRKLGRGRHTTRHVQLYPVCDGYVADTPGFSALDLEDGEFIHKDDLAYCFPEFAPFFGECRFTSCAHVCDSGCRVVQAVEDGVIPRSRHESYITFYRQAREIKDWQIK